MASATAHVAKSEIARDHRDLVHISSLAVRAGVGATVRMADTNVESIPIPDISSLESGRKAQMVKFGAPERAVQNDVFNLACEGGREE